MLTTQKSSQEYSPYINHFIQPDTIIPNPSDPQSWNRYSYTQNNPIRYTDPSGHSICEDMDGGKCDIPANLDQLHLRIKSFGVNLNENWNDHVNEEWAVFFAVRQVGTKLAEERGKGESAARAFKDVLGYVDMTWGGEGATGDCASTQSGGCTSNSHQINFWSMSGHLYNEVSRMTKNVVHEIAHVFDKSLGYYSPEGNWIQESNNMPTNVYYDGVRDQVLRPNMAGGEPSPQHYDWQQHPPAMDVLGWSRSETFADIFIAWVYNTWNTDPYYSNNVSDVQNYMNGLVP